MQSKRLNSEDVKQGTPGRLYMQSLLTHDHVRIILRGSLISLMNIKVWTMGEYGDGRINHRPPCLCSTKQNAPELPAALASGFAVINMCVAHYLAQMLKLRRIQLATRHAVSMTVPLPYDLSSMPVQRRKNFGFMQPL
jgi:hypothetical protein